MTPSRRLLLAFTFGVAATCVVILVLSASPTVHDHADAIDSPEEEANASVRLRGHPSAAHDVLTGGQGPGVVDGLVLDETGRPVAGIPIRTRREWEPYRRNVLALPLPGEGRREPAFDGAAVSDADGRFRIEGLAEGVRTWVWAFPPPPYGKARALATPRGDRAAYVTLHLHRGAELQGRVVDAEGCGIPAWIDGELPFLGARRARGSGGWCVRGLASDADGRFRIDVVPDGIVWLSAFAPGVGSRTFHPVRVPARGDVLLRLGEVPGATLQGGIRDVAGRPVADAQVFARVQGRLLGAGFQEMSGCVGRSGADGQYRIQGLPSGRIQEVRVEAQGFLASRYLGHGIDLAVGEIVPFDIVLLRGCTLKGRVVDEAGRPIADVRVWAATLQAPGSPPLPAHGEKIHTDSGGHYRLEGVLAGRKSVLAHHPGHTQSKHVLVDAADGAVLDVLDVVLAPKASATGATPETLPDPEPTGSITGRLLTPDGVPASDLEILGVSDAAQRPCVAIVGPHGVFHLPAVAPGSWRLRPQAKGGAPRGDEVTVEVTPGARVYGVEVVTYAPRLLSGVVVDERGEPAVGISVSAHAPGRERYGTSVARASTDLDGAFTLTLYEEGSWLLSVHGRRVEGSYESGQRGIRLVHRVPETRRVVIVVRDPAGRSLLRAAVKVKWTPPRSRGTERAARPGGGRYYAEVPAATEVVDVMVGGALDALGRPLDVAPIVLKDVPLGDDPIEILLEPSRSLQVSVSDPDGRPVEGALVRVRSLEGAAERAPHWQAGGPDIHRTDAQGRCTALGLSPDVRLVAIVVAEGPHANPPPVLVGTDVDSVDVRLLRSTILAGRVADEAGRPLAGIGVAAYLAGPSRETWHPVRVTVPAPPFQGWRSVTDAEGRFSLDGIPVGTTLHVSTGGGGEYLRADVPDVVAGTTDLLLTPAAGARVRGRLVGVDAWASEARPRVELHEDADTDERPMSPITARSPGEDGAFDLGPVPPGRYRLVVVTGPHLLFDARVHAPGEGLELALASRYQLVVQVVGERVEGFVVTVVDASKQRSATSVDASGVASFTFLDDAPRRVFVWREGDERLGQVDAVRPSGGTVRVTLRRGLAIAGRIEGAPAGAVSGFHVQVGNDEVSRVVKPADDGTFRVVGLPPGTYAVRVFAPRSAGRIEPLPGITAGREDLVLRFEPR